MTNIIKKIISLITKSKTVNETGLGVGVLSIQDNTLQQVQGNHNLVERTPVYFTKQSKTTQFPAGLSDSVQYYAIKVQPTQFCVGLTPETNQPVALLSQGSAYLFTGKNPKGL